MQHCNNKMYVTSCFSWLSCHIPCHVTLWREASHYDVLSRTLTVTSLDTSLDKLIYNKKSLNLTPSPWHCQLVTSSRLLSSCLWRLCIVFWSKVWDHFFLHGWSLLYWIILLLTRYLQFSLSVYPSILMLQHQDISQCTLKWFLAPGWLLEGWEEHCKIGLTFVVLRRADDTGGVLRECSFAYCDDSSSSCCCSAIQSLRCTGSLASFPVGCTKNDYFCRCGTYWQKISWS